MNRKPTQDELTAPPHHTPEPSASDAAFNRTSPALDRPGRRAWREDIVANAASIIVFIVSASLISLVLIIGLLLGYYKEGVLSTSAYTVAAAFAAAVLYLALFENAKFCTAWRVSRLITARTLYQLAAPISYLPLFMPRLGPAWVLFGVIACICGYQAVTYRRLVPLAHNCAYRFASLINRLSLAQSSYAEDATEIQQLLKQYAELLPQVGWAHPGLRGSVEALQLLYPSSQQTATQLKEAAAALPERIPQAARAIVAGLSNIDTPSHGISAALAARLFVIDTDQGQDKSAVKELLGLIHSYDSEMKLVLGPSPRSPRNQQSWEAWCNARAVAWLLQSETPWTSTAASPDEPITEASLVELARGQFAETSQDSTASAHARQRARNNAAETDLRQLMRIGDKVGNQIRRRSATPIILDVIESTIWTEGESRLEQHRKALRNSMADIPNPVLALTQAQITSVLAHSYAQEANQLQKDSPLHRTQVALIRDCLRDIEDCLAIALWSGGASRWADVLRHDAGLCWVLGHSLQTHKYDPEIAVLFEEAEADCLETLRRFGLTYSCETCTRNGHQRQVPPSNEK